MMKHTYGCAAAGFLGEHDHQPVVGYLSFYGAPLVVASDLFWLTARSEAEPRIEQGQLAEQTHRLVREEMCTKSRVFS